MSTLLDAGWWIEGLTREGAWRWWLVVALWSALALPLALRAFRGLADRGAGMILGLGPVLVWALAWVLGLRGLGSDPSATKVRLVVIAAGVAVASAPFALAWWLRRQGKFAPNPSWRQAALPLAAGGALVLCGLIHLPHGPVAVWAAALLLALLSAACLLEGRWLLRRLRQGAPVLVLTQILFALGFAFFVQVRSHIPHATFDPGMWGAEKFGNLTHLNATLQARSLPPADPWFAGEPTNYYYGGHLFVATIAKGAGFDVRRAFNLGLATVFGLTLALGFSFVFNLVTATWRPRAQLPGVFWGLIGALAIACFGNLDAVQQAFARDPATVRQRVADRLDQELMREQLWLHGTLLQSEQETVDEATRERRLAERAEARAAELAERQEMAAKAAAAQPEPPEGEAPEETPAVELPEGWGEGFLPGDYVASLNRTEIRQQYDQRVPVALHAELLQERQREVAARLSGIGLLALRPAALQLTDFWRSSRAYKSSPENSTEIGTITEFPYFSAMLGDLHPHHMALPFSLLALAAALSLLRLGRRFVGPRTDAAWWRRCAGALVLLGLTIGFVFPVNIWDAVVLAPLAGFAVAIAARRLRVDSWAWVWVAFLGMMVLGTLVLALVHNMQRTAQPLFPSPALWALGIVLAALAVVGGHRSMTLRLVCFPLSVLVVALGAFLAAYQHNAYVLGPMRQLASGAAAGARDGLLFLAVLVAVSLWAMSPLPGRRRFAAWGAAYLVVGVVALAAILPFKVFFTTPINKVDPLFNSYLPPVLNSEVLAAGVNDQFIETVWARSPVNPFDKNLRTELRDYLTHWGLFLVPILALMAARGVLAMGRVRGGDGKLFAVLGFLVALLAFSFNSLTTWTGPVALVLTVSAAMLAWFRWNKADAPAWTFLAAAFFFHWFVEGLHFDDQYGGNLERYNTPFKIFYPLWPIMAGGAVLALKTFAEWLAGPRAPAAERRDFKALATDPLIYAGILILLLVVPWFLRTIGLGDWVRPWQAAAVVVLAVALVAMAVQMFRPRLRTGDFALSRLRSATAMAPALLLAAVFCALGLVYFIGATANRTVDFHRDSLTYEMGLRREALARQREADPEAALPTVAPDPRTLDALAYLESKDVPGKAGLTLRGDAQAVRWLQEHARPGDRILEAPGAEVYNVNGRIAAATGLPTLLGWKHHQFQWRGWSSRMSPRMMERFADRFTLEELGLREVARELLGATGYDAEKVRAIKALVALPMEVRERPALLTQSIQKHYPEHASATDVPQDNASSAPRVTVRDYSGPRAEALQDLFPDLSEYNQRHILGMLRDKKAPAVMDLAERLATDAAAIYESPHLERGLLEFYGIDYVVVGSLERDRYSSEALAKFEALEKVFEEQDAEGRPVRNGTIIYRVRERASDGVGA